MLITILRITYHYGILIKPFLIEYFIKIGGGRSINLLFSYLLLPTVIFQYLKKKIDLQYNTINIKLVSIHTELWAILYEIQLWYCHNHGHTNVLQVPDYYEIIKHPLDFQIVKDRLQCLVYGSVEECLEDVKLVFNNCETYNSVSMCT